MTDEHRCTEWRARASCRLDGELDELQAARLERHLLGCAACRAWTREVATLAGLLQTSEPMRPARSLELWAQAPRLRFLRASAIGAAVASAAALAALALGLPGSGTSRFSFSSTPAVSAAPCASCVKKQALTPPAPAPVAAPIHVVNPLVDPQSG